jgi:hypothetical protein
VQQVRIRFIGISSKLAIAEFHQKKNPALKKAGFKL